MSDDVRSGAQRAAKTPQRDVMQRLMAVEALPRGERIALRSVTPPIEKPFLKDPLWGRLINRSIVLLALDEAPVFGRSECADLWRSYAAPLRKCRKERLQWRTHAMEFAEYVAAQGTVGDGNLDSMCRSDVTDAMEFLETHGKVIIDETLSDRWVRGRWVR